MESLGYHINDVEKTHRFSKKNDLFSSWFYENDFKGGGFDLVACKENELVLIQAKTNQTRGIKPYQAFVKAMKFFDCPIRVEIWTYYDFKGFKIHRFFEQDHKIIEIKNKKTSYTDYHNLSN